MGRRIEKSQKFAVLKDLADGADTESVCRKYGVSPQSVYRWSNQFNKPSRPSGERGQHVLESENTALKEILIEKLLEDYWKRNALNRNLSNAINQKNPNTIKCDENPNSESETKPDYRD
jgi:transposase-like protein